MCPLRSLLMQFFLFEYDMIGKMGPKSLIKISQKGKKNVNRKRMCLEIRFCSIELVC